VEFVKYMIIVGMSSYKNHNKADIVYIEGDGPPPSDLCRDPKFTEEVGILFNRLNEEQRKQFYTEYIKNEIAIKYLEDYRRGNYNISEAFRKLCANGYINFLGLTRDVLSNILYIDYYIVPIVKAFNKLTPEGREALFTRFKFKEYLKKELREITLTKEKMIEYIFEYHIDQALLKPLFQYLTEKTMEKPVITGKKRSRTNSNSNINGLPRPTKRVLFEGGSKKHKKRKSRTMKKRK
jgi:hypothetical protein